VEDGHDDGLTTPRTGADVRCLRPYDWRTIDKSGGEPLASTAHMAHEF